MLRKSHITRCLMTLLTEMHWTSKLVHVKRNSHVTGRRILILLESCNSPYFEGRHCIDSVIPRIENPLFNGTPRIDLLQVFSSHSWGRKHCAKNSDCMGKSGNLLANNFERKISALKRLQLVNQRVDLDCE